MRYLIIVLIFLSSSFFLTAQEQLGLRADNYAGINGVFLNPTHNLTSPFGWDINLISAGFNFQNSYAFAKKSNLFHTLRRTDRAILQRDIESPNTITDDDLVIDFYDNKRLKYISIFANGMGPSFMINLESGHTFGIFTNARFGFSTQDLPYELNANIIYEQPYYEYQYFDAFNITSMGWAELGLNYAFKKETYDGSIGFGANLKFINAFEGAFVKTNRVNPTAQIPGDSLQFETLSIDFGVTTPNALGDGTYDVTRTGNGLSLDLGFSYVYEGYEDNYKWKLGASLLDVGQIRFNKFAETHDIFVDTVQILVREDYETGSVKTRIEELSFNTLGAENASLKGNNFSVWTPAALSLQFDFMLTENIYANATAVQRIVFGETALRRNNLFAITPRYEHRWFGAALPISVINYDKLMIGTSLRIAFLTIGSDDLFGLIGKSNFNGADFYFALKLNPFETNLNLFGGGNRRSNKGVKCYEF